MTRHRPEPQQPQDEGSPTGRIACRSGPGPAGVIRPRLAIVLLLAVVAGFGLLAVRIGQLAGPEGARLRRLADRQHTTRVPIPARRGNILDCRGRLLAGSLQVPSIYADPALIRDVQGAAEKLQRSVGLPAEQIAGMITARRGKRFAWIRRGVTEQQAEEVRSLRLRGIGVMQEPRRCYPMGALAAHVLGFVGAEQKGLEGLEYLYDRYLRGRDGRKVCWKDAAGRIVGLVPNGYQPARDGCDVILSIDSFIQYVAEQALSEAVERYEAEAGVAIVTEPDTGEILAMACRPTFDPNHFAEAPGSARRNRAITDPVEPGSTFKPFVASAALEEGKVRPGEVIFCHNGTYVSGRRRLRDHHPYGKLTFEQVVAKSSNIGMAILGERLGNLLMWRHLKRLGFGAKTGIDLPGEDAGIFLPLARWTSYSTDSIPMGQEIAVTPIQLIRAFNALVNGGRLLRPKVVRAVVGPTGAVVLDRRRAESPGQVIDPAVARYMVQVVLKAVVNEGTGRRARLKRWQVVGKTGTAQIARRGGGGYEPDAYVSSFVCAAPASRPRVSVLVMVFRPNPRIAYYGGTVAAPAAKKILAAALEYLGVPADPPAPSTDQERLRTILAAKLPRR